MKLKNWIVFIHIKGDLLSIIEDMDILCVIS